MVYQCDALTLIPYELLSQWAADEVEVCSNLLVSSLNNKIGFEVVF